MPALYFDHFKAIDIPEEQLETKIKAWQAIQKICYFRKTCLKVVLLVQKQPLWLISTICRPGKPGCLII